MMGSTFCDGVLLVAVIGSLLILGVLSDISIERAPQNVAVLAGGSVEFQCAIQQSDQLPSVLAWEECITTPVSCRRISIDETIIYESAGGNLARHNRYHVNRVGSSNQFNLVISDVIMADDAGKYRCFSLNNAATLADAQLVVLESETNCTLQNSSVSSTDSQKPLTVSIQCQVSYSGSTEPIIGFIKEDTRGMNSTLLGSKDENAVSGTVRYTLDYNVRTGDTRIIFYARTYFRMPTEGGDKEATNAPSYEHFVKFDALNYEGSGSVRGTTPMLLLLLTMFSIISLCNFK